MIVDTKKLLVNTTAFSALDVDRVAASISENREWHVVGDDRIGLVELEVGFCQRFGSVVLTENNLIDEFERLLT